MAIYMWRETWQPGANTVAYYQFDGNLNDSSGNGHNMSIYGGTLTYGTESGGGKYAYFDNAWTNYWERSFDYDSGNTVSFRVNYTTAAGFAVEMWKSGTAYARISSAGVFQFLSPDVVDAQLSSGTWHLLTQTRTGTTVKCYVDGVLVGTGTNSASGTYNTRIKFNNPGDTNSSSYAGQYKMSEFIWEDKERTATEILEYYNQTKANYEPQPRQPGANTVAYYTFDDQNANQITDVVNGYNLTTGTMPTYTQVSGTNYAGNFAALSTGAGMYNSFSGWTSFVNSTLTEVIWLKITDTGARYITMFNDNSNQTSLIYGFNSGQIESYGDTRATILSNTQLNTWYCIGLTRTTSTLTFYVNGTQTATTSKTHNQNSNLKFYVGGSNNAGDRTKGQIGEVIIENQIWTAQEMLDYYNKTKGNYGL